MDERQQDWELPETTRLRPASLGRGLPVPPIIPIVAALGLVFGIALGVGVVPKPEPSVVLAPSPVALITPAPSPAPSLAPSLAPTNSPAGVAELPPTSGYSLAKVLKDLQPPGIADPAILSARVGHYPGVSPDWVWLVIVPFSVETCGNHWVYQAIPRPTLEPCGVKNTTELFILDYSTGTFLEDRIPADTSA